jgi:hypothetical protein
MKSSPAVEALSGALPVRPQNLEGEQLRQSLFSLLLEIEAKLRAEARRDSFLQAKSAKTAKCKNLRRLSVV